MSRRFEDWDDRIFWGCVRDLERGWWPRPPWSHPFARLASYFRYRVSRESPKR